jgi:hypothetical protein
MKRGDVKMATNTGNSYRKGSVKNRIQIYNTKTKLYSKINTINGKIIDTKTSGGKFKGVAEYVDDRLK